MKHRIGILLSGRGSNFVALAESVATGIIPNAEIAVVLSNKAEASGLLRAHELGIVTSLSEGKGRTRAEHDAEIADVLRQKDVDLICLAGYMRLLSPAFVQTFPLRILNIHPSLLPAFPGLNAQKQALEYGAQCSGCTVHFVDEQLDHGVIVLQKPVPILSGDDEETLAARILEQEHRAYPEAVRRVLSGDYQIHGRRYLPKMREHAQPGKAREDRH